MLRELSKTLESLPADPAPRKVHKLRTASRRLEAMAPLLDSPKKSRRFLKAIEPVRKAAGSVRDMDVLMAHARRMRRYGAGESLAQLFAYLESARQKHAAELVCVLRHRRHAALKDLKEYLKHVSSALKHSSAGPIESQEKLHDAAMLAVRELGHSEPLDAGNLHDFRLKVKYLRYTLQLDENADHDLLTRLDDVQRSIGDWHDWQQLAEIAHEALAIEPDRQLVERIDRTAKRRFDRAMATASALRATYLAMPMARYV